MPGKQIYFCFYCGERFRDYPSRARGAHTFCSKSCVAQFRFSKVLPACGVCGKPVNKHKNQYCSRDCRGASQKTGREVECCICGDQSYMPLNRIKSTGKFYCSPECRQQGYPEQILIMRAALRHKRLSEEGTLPERIMAQLLDDLGIEYEREKPIGRFYVDFFLAKGNICIEADGDYWHGNKESDRYTGAPIQITAIERDNRKAGRIHNEGYRLLRFWESDIKNNLELVSQAIQEAINDDH